MSTDKTSSDIANLFWDDVITSHKIQTGLDTWILKKNLGPIGFYDRDAMLYLADSQPVHNYHNPSAWLKADVSAQTGNLIFRLRYDNNQSLGSRIDELSLDWSRHAIGLRAGILSYKVSWCRTHDVDAPWIRENDPFCAAHTTSNPIKSSPGFQIYANTQISTFKVQSVAGLYRPLQFNYDTKEFTSYNDAAHHVIQNNKHGLSFNAIDLETGLELRLSFLQSNQMANYAKPQYPTTRTDQNTNARFIAISKNITPVLNLRLSQFNSTENSKNKYPEGFVTAGDTDPALFYILNRERISKVLELNYQHTARDVFSLAYSKYDAIDLDQNLVRSSPSPAIKYTQQRINNFNNTSKSIGWRRDWQKGIFTVVQITRADLRQTTDNIPGITAIQYSESMGKALGFRLGYAF